MNPLHEITPKQCADEYGRSAKWWSTRIARGQVRGRVEQGFMVLNGVRIVRNRYYTTVAYAEAYIQATHTTINKAALRLRKVG